MRILEAVSQTGRNGAMIYARRIIPLLRARGHEVWLAAKADSWIARETAGEAALFETDFSRWPLAELRRVADFCRSERIDVTHSHLTRASNFCLLLRLLHGIPAVAHAHSHQFQPHWYLQKMVVAVSRETLRRHRRRGAAWGRRGRVLHNFVDVSKFAPAPATEAGGLDPLRAACAIPAGAPVVLQVGEINPRKGQLDTLQAAAQVHRAHPGARFAFVGTERCGDDYRQALRVAETSGGLTGAVTWLGPREDIARLLPHATIAILPSHQESFSLAGLEAMACRLPVVASKVGGFPEMMDDGVNGLLVPPHDAGALADAISGLLADPARRDSLAQAARSRTLVEFGPDAHMTRLEALLAEGARV